MVTKERKCEGNLVKHGVYDRNVWPSERSKESKGTTLNRDAKQEVVEVMRHYVNGYGQNNVAVLDKILAEDFVFISSRGIVISKTQELSDIGSGKMKTESASIDDLEVRVRGSAAIVNGRATLKGVWHGQDFSGQYRVTATWVKGRWTLAIAG